MTSTCRLCWSAVGIQSHWHHLCPAGCQSTSLVWSSPFHNSHSAHRLWTHSGCWKSKSTGWTWTPVLSRLCSTCYYHSPHSGSKPLSESSLLSHMSWSCSVKPPVSVLRRLVNQSLQYRTKWLECSNTVFYKVKRVEQRIGCKKSNSLFQHQLHF
jgi:hypothetical protein